MNVGDYVRTKRDGIGKIISFSYNEDDDCCFIELANRRTGIKEYNIIKSSPQIIDLIEVGDLMYIDISPDNYGGIIVPRIAETENELNKYKEKINSGEYILKAIITHKQLESEAYRVEE